MVLYWFEMKNDEVLQQANQVDQHFTANDPMIYGTEGDFVVHPPVGKWLIGWGEAPFGILNSFGWRFAVALAGTISIFMLGRIARRLFRSDLLGTVAAALLAFEGHHFVHSRTGLLDIFVMFFGSRCLRCLLIDRDRAREVLARRVGDQGALRHVVDGAVARLAAMAVGRRHHARPLRRREVVGPLLPRLLRAAHRAVGPRCAPGRRGAGLVGRRGRQGRAVCVRAGRRHRRRHVRRELDRLDPHQGGSFRTWAQNNPDTAPRLAAGLVALAVGLPPADVRLDAGDHELAPVPDQPVVLAHPGAPDVVLLRRAEEGRRRLPRRPVQQGDHLDSARRRSGGARRSPSSCCSSCGRCAATGGPARSCAGLLAGYLPWFLLGNRTIYSFYAVAFVPYVVLACVYVLGWSSAGATRRRPGAASGLGMTGAFVLLDDRALRVLPPDLRRRRHPALGVAGPDVVPQAGSEGYID